MRRLFFIIFMCCSAISVAQSQLTWQEFAEQFIYADEENALQRETLYELLYDMYSNPIELNSAKVEQLLELPFLSEEQANDIIAYREKYKPMRSLGELMLVKSLGYMERQYLTLFCCVDEGQARGDTLTFKRLMKGIHHEAILRTEIPFYTKAGHMSYSDSILRRYPNRVYKGDRMYGSVRYNLKSLNHLYMGLQAEKDHGERGVDYVSAYMHLRDIKLGKGIKLKDVIAGNFKGSFGMGLALSNGFSMGKTMALNRNVSIDRGFTHHSSMTEYGYFTGVAAALQYRWVTASVYAAYNPIDGTLLNDSSGISALKTDGLHRTGLERSKHHNTKVLNIGGNLHFDIRNVELSLTAVHTGFNRALKPQWHTPSTLYRRYNPAGRSFQNYSISYAWRYRRIRLAGETALSRASGVESPQIGFATLNMLSYKPNSSNALTLLYRQYSAKYTVINSNAFSENSSPQNETGIYMAWQTTMIPMLEINTYVDMMYFPWLRSQVSKASYGIDAAADVAWKVGKNSTLSLRYKVKSKQKDFKYSSLGGVWEKSDKVALQYNTRQTIRLQYRHSFNDHWNIATQANVTLMKFSIERLRSGFSISQSAKWTGRNKNLHVTLAATYFNTDGSETATYGYEPSMLYDYGLHTYMYHGVRPLLLVNVPITRWLTMGVKGSATIYFDRTTIGSGTEKIFHSHREDVEVELKVKI